jgi:antitoxin component YwqK of YwqJK toxin-antitoxin module
MARSLFVFLSLAIIVCTTTKIFAQPAFSANIPLAFTSEEDNRLIKENDSLKYYVATGDTSNTVCLDEEASYYKLLNKDHKLIAEGAFVAEGDKYMQVGKWTEHFANGKVKTTGYYDRSRPIGTWQEFYNTGKLKTVCNYAVISDKGVNSFCISGTYQEYYPSGKIKVSGFYSAVSKIVVDTTFVEDPTTEQKLYTTLAHNVYTPEKVGRWEYFSEEGDLEKKDDF